MQKANELAGNEGYVYDAQDLMRMVLTIATDDYFEIMKRAFAVGDAETLETYGKRYLDAMHLVSHCATFNPDELLGNWLGRAYDWMDADCTGKYDDFDRDMMTMNAKILITTWASSPISNYGNRQYNGLMEDYYIRMWEELITKAVDALKKGERIRSHLGARCFEIGWEFNLGDKTYSRKTTDPADANEGLVATWEKVQAHLLTDDIPATIAKLDEQVNKLIAEMKAKEEEAAALSATVATNIEH